jgi:Protein of unknown function (DUF1688)
MPPHARARPGGHLTAQANATDAAWRLLSAEAVRARAHQLLAAGLDDRLDHFTIDCGRLDGCADAVVATIRANYPDLNIPFHARWRHFAAGGVDRWAAVAGAAPWPDDAAMTRAAFDLAIISVLLDAGAGSAWRYHEGRTGETFTRSEGLAVASFDLFVGGAFSARPEDPFRVDAEALAVLTPEDLRQGFQAGPDNPLVGLEGRAALLNRLGEVVTADPETFGRADDPRPGGLFDALAEQPEIGAPAILEAVLRRLGPIWPGRINLSGINLGDTWWHPLAKTDDATDGLVPFHKLSQWLSYSLIEPLEWAGMTVTDIDGLTGLPEYRNGGLFLDTDVLRLRDPAEAERPHPVDSPLVVEWRALTVALLDRVAPLIRAKLGLPNLTLAQALEGGTWATGRRLARERRPNGAPPLRVISDGTVF